MNALYELINYLVTLDWLVVGPQLVALATILTAITPTRADNKLLDFLLRSCNVAAGNILKNKNKDDI